MQVDTYQEWIDAELNQWEQAMIDGYEEAAQFHSHGSRLCSRCRDSAGRSNCCGWRYDGGAAAAAALPILRFTVGMKSAATGAAIGAEKRTQIAAVWASYERP